MTKDTYNVLFLCTGNSARSIIAEAILNRESGGRFRAFSAGSKPGPAPHPYTLDLLKGLNHDIGFARSKSWTRSPDRTRRKWISCSPSATTPLPRNAPTGRASR